MKSDIDAASLQLTGTILGFRANYKRVRDLGTVVEIGLPDAKQRIYNEASTLPEWMESALEWKFPDPSIHTPEKRDWLSTKITEVVIGDIQGSVNAASLIFAHSILDDVASECCKIILVAAPTEWEDVVQNKKVSFAELSERNPDVIKWQLVRKYVDGLGREKSLIDRIELIQAKCKPSEDIIVDGKAFCFDNDRIRRIDRDRQDIIHRVQLKTTSPNLTEDIQYMEDTCGYLVSMVGQRFKIPLDVQRWMRLQQKNLKATSQ